MIGVQKATKAEAKFLCADDVAAILQVSQTTAYRIIKRLNTELQQQGKITTAGKVSRRYFEEKVYL